MYQNCNWVNSIGQVRSSHRSGCYVHGLATGRQLVQKISWSWDVSFWRCTSGQTDRHRDTLIAIFRTPTGGGVSEVVSISSISGSIIRRITVPFLHLRLVWY